MVIHRRYVLGEESRRVSGIGRFIEGTAQSGRVGSRRKCRKFGASELFTAPPDVHARPRESVETQLRCRDTLRGQTVASRHRVRVIRQPWSPGKTSFPRPARCGVLEARRGRSLQRKRRRSAWRGREPIPGWCRAPPSTTACLQPAGSLGAHGQIRGLIRRSSRRLAPHRPGVEFRRDIRVAGPSDAGCAVIILFTAVNWRRLPTSDIQRARKSGRSTAVVAAGEAAQTAGGGWSRASDVVDGAPSKVDIRSRKQSRVSHRATVHGAFA